MSRPPVAPAQRQYGARIGRWIAERRERAGISAPELARRSGVSVDAIRSIEGARVASPGFQIIAALVASLDGSLDQLSRDVSIKPRSTE